MNPAARGSTAFPLLVGLSIKQLAELMGVPKGAVLGKEPLNLELKR